MNNKKLYQNALSILHSLPARSPSYRKMRLYLTKMIVEDLAVIGYYSGSFDKIHVYDVRKLVELWGLRNNSKNTVLRKLTQLRILMLAAVPQFNFPSNSDLDLKTAEPKTLNVKCNLVPEHIPIAGVRLLCMLQYYFGLKKSEAIRFQGLLQGDYLLISRSESYNGKSRFVRIVLPAQRQLLMDLLSNKMAFDNQSHLHREVLLSLSIEDPDYFRYGYMNWRYDSLINLPHLQKLKVLRHELGYCDNRKIKAVLKCQKGF